MMFETRREPKDSPSTIRKKLESVRASAYRVQRVRRKPRSRDFLPAIEKAFVKKLNNLGWPVLGEVADRAVMNVSPGTLGFTVDGVPEPAAVVEKALRAKNNHVEDRRPTGDARHSELIRLMARIFDLEIRASWSPKKEPTGPLFRLMRAIYPALARARVMRHMSDHAIDERIREAAGERRPQRLAKRLRKQRPPS
jgi:hypothetical protein